MVKEYEPELVSSEAKLLETSHHAQTQLDDLRLHESSMESSISGKICFASDNYVPAHPLLVEDVHSRAAHCQLPYGEDACTQEARSLLMADFGEDISVVWTISGTASNVLAIKATCSSFQSVVSSPSSHILTDECGAVEAVTGCRICPLPVLPDQYDSSKVTLLQLQTWFDREVQPRLPTTPISATFVPKPKLLSITQPTEFGTAYTDDEIRALATWCHQHEILLHMDGARLPYVAASIGTARFRGLTRDLGVDLLSLGMTKAGAMMCECLVFFPSSHLEEGVLTTLPYLAKQALQVVSKQSYMTAQMAFMLRTNSWFDWAARANMMAAYLYEQIALLSKDRPSVCPWGTEPPAANAVFVYMPSRSVIERMQDRFLFYVWEDHTNMVRLMTSYATTKEHIDLFMSLLRKNLDA